MNILVCIPYHRHISNETLRSCEQLRDGDGLHFRFAKLGGSNISANRNDCVTGDWHDAVLWVDSDMGFTLADLKSMIARDVEICSGAYFYKGRDDLMVAGDWLADYPGCIGPGGTFTRDAAGLRLADWCGAGFLLVRKMALAIMPYPWFCERIVKVPPGNPHPQRNVGEDMGFCMLARECNIQVYVDCDIRIKHIQEDAPMSEDKKTIPMSISDKVMALNADLIELARNYGFIAQALKEKTAECDKLKAELAAKVV